MAEHSSIKIVVTTGDVETTFDIPSAKNFEMDVKYKEPSIRMSDRKFDTVEVESLSFTMYPLPDLAGKYVVITRREDGEVVL